MKQVSLFLEVVVIAVVLVTTSYSLAGAESLDFQYEQTLRIGNSKDDDAYVHTFSINRYPVDITDNVELLVSPYIEGNWNFETSEWFRKEAGVEAGIQLTEFIYIGESLNYVSRGKEAEEWPNEDKEFAELETRLKLTSRFYDWRILEAQFYVFDEYALNLSEGAEYLNVVRFGIMLKINDWLRIPVGGRHTDQVHRRDYDHGELSVIINF